MSNKKKSRLGRTMGALLAGAREESPAIKGNAQVSQGKQSGSQSSTMTASKTSHVTQNSEAPQAPQTTRISHTIPNNLDINPINSTHHNNPDPNTFEALQNFFELPIKNLQPGKYQPRKDFEPSELESLADSIRAQGIIQPVLVRHLSQDNYEIIAGERRFRAAKLVGLEKIPVVVKKVEDKSAMAMALIENIQRTDLNPLEEAQALDRLSKEFGLTHIQVAEAVGKSRATVTNLLRLLTLTDETKNLLERGEIDLGHAKVLLALRGHQQNQVARQVKIRGLSVRETERLVSKLLDDSFQTSNSSQKPMTLDPDVRRLQDSLSQKLGAAVQIVQGNQGKGKLVIQYHSLDELDGIIEHIK